MVIPLEFDNEDDYRAFRDEMLGDNSTAEEIIKHKPEIIEMGKYYAGGFVYVSTNIAPQEWIEHSLEGAESTKQIQQAVAMYTAPQKISVNVVATRLAKARQRRC